MTFGLIGTLILTALGAEEAAKAPTPLLSVRLVRPEKMGASVIDLFRGSRADHPAAALAAWRHVSRNPGLGKRREALISVFNPAMVREMKVLDGAEFRLVPRPDTATSWQVVFPRDDGTLKAAASAIALTDGTTETDIDGHTVFRLGPADSAFALEKESQLLLASDMEMLRASFPEEPTPTTLKDFEGCLVRLDPKGLRGLKTLNALRVAEALETLGCTEGTGQLTLIGQAIDFRLTTRLKDPLMSRPALDPDWMSMIPKDGVVAAVAVAVDTSPSSLEFLFSLFDRVEKVNAAYAGVAPLRSRLNLLAATVKVFPDQDLWPVLRGLTAVALANPVGEVSGGLLALHARDEAGARILFDRVLPRIAKAYFGEEKLVPGPDDIRPYGVIGGQPMTSKLRGKSILLAWGNNSLANGLEAWDHPDHSAGQALVESWGSKPPQRCGAFWPGRLREIVSPGSALAKSFQEAPPMTWVGFFEGDTLRDQIRWTELSGVVKRWLEALPLDPPPDK